MKWKSAGGIMPPARVFSENYAGDDPINAREAGSGKRIYIDNIICFA